MVAQRKRLFLRQTTTRAASIWRGNTGSGVPSGAILAEDGSPILTESGQYLEIET